MGVQGIRMRTLHIAMGALGVLLLLTGCHDRWDGVEQWCKKLPYDHWRFSFIYPANLPSVVTQVLLEDGDIRETIFRRLDPMDVSDLSVGRWHDMIGGYGGYFN